MTWHRPNQPIFVGEFNQTATELDRASALMTDERYDTLRTQHDYEDAVRLAVQGTHEYLKNLTMQEALQDETGNLGALKLEQHNEKVAPYTEFEAKRWLSFVDTYLAVQLAPLLSELSEDETAFKENIEQAYERQEVLYQGVLVSDRITTELCAAIEQKRVQLSTRGEDVREPISFANHQANRALINAIDDMLPLADESPIKRLGRIPKIRKGSYSVERKGEDSYRLLRRIDTPEGFRTETTAFADGDDGIVRVQTGKARRWDMLNVIDALHVISPEASIDLSQETESTR